MTTPTIPETTSAAPAPSTPVAGDFHGRRALEWWRQHCHPVSGDPGTRARLRRARSRLDLLQISAAADLARRLRAVPPTRAAPDWLLHAALDLARVLAHVKEHELRHPMEAAGWKSFPRDRKESDAGADRPRLSGARFKRLLETGDGDEKVAAFTRLIALLDGAVNVERLASDFLMWNHPEHGDRVRERWAFHYFAAGSAAPAAPSIDAEDLDE